VTLLLEEWSTSQEDLGREGVTEAVQEGMTVV
jgi:hypothetical protein